MSDEEDSCSTAHYLWKHKQEVFRNKLVWLFLIVCFGFTCFQLYVSMITGSLGGYTDCLHRIEHIITIILVICGNVLTKRRKDMRYTYGYGRHEFFIVFTMDLSIVIICCFLLFELLHGLLEGHHEYGEHVTSTIGHYNDVISYVSFAISLVFIFGFQKYKKAFESRFSQDIFKANMSGKAGISGEDVIHICIDIFTMLFMWTSNYLSVKKGVQLADSIECLMMSLFMLYTTIPTLKTSASALVLGVSDELAQEIRTLFRRISALDGVIEIKEGKYWIEGPGYLTGTLNIEAHRQADKQKLLMAIQSMCANTFQEISIQINQDPSLEWMD